VVDLTEDERLQPLAWSRRSTSANGLATRSRIVLAAAEGMSNTAIANKLDIHSSSARKWRTRFGSQRLDGLLDEARPGRPRTAADEQVEAVITATLETTPRDATHWSTWSLAAELGMSQSAVSRSGGLSVWLRTNRIRGNRPWIRCSEKVRDLESVTHYCRRINDSAHQ
jgi:transposase